MFVDIWLLKKRDGNPRKHLISREVFPTIWEMLKPWRCLGLEVQLVPWGRWCTVLFHSIRHPAWHITSLPKFWFRQTPDLNVTSKYFRQVGCKFCVGSLKIVHCQLNYIYYLHNACKHNWLVSGIFFLFLIHFFFEFSDGFGTLPRFALPALHFSKFEHCVICDCQIEWYTAVLKKISWKKIHFYFSLHDYHSIQLQLFSSQDLGFPD